MARKTVRVDLPTSNPDKLLHLCRAIVNQHLKAGDSSPVKALESVDDGIKMADIEALLVEAEQKRAEAKELEARVQALNGEVAQLTGLAHGQTSRTKSTLYSSVVRIRDFLLSLYRGNENTLEIWGFNVTIGVASTRRQTPSTTAENESETAEGDLMPS